MKKSNDQMDQNKWFEEAAEWFLKFKEGDVSPEEAELWLEWLQKDERNERAFNGAEALWRKLEDIKGASLPAQTDIDADGYYGSVRVSDLSEPKLHEAGGEPSLVDDSKAIPQPNRWRGSQVAFALAASFALVFVGLWFYPSERPEPLLSQRAYETSAAEHSDVMLDDGSSITLGARSRAHVFFSQTQRRVNLERGEATFEVTKDVARPFVVSVGSREVRVTGTLFNVKRRAAGSVVTVVEGVVRIADASSIYGQNVQRTAQKNSKQSIPKAAPVQELTAGQEISVALDGSLSVVRDVDATLAIRWHEGVFEYVDQPLAEVLEDVSRYMGRDIILGDMKIGDLRFSGTVVRGKEQEWLAAMARGYRVDVLDQKDNSIKLIWEPADSISD